MTVYFRDLKQQLFEILVFKINNYKYINKNVRMKGITVFFYLIETNQQNLSFRYILTYLK